MKAKYGRPRKISRTTGKLILVAVAKRVPILKIAVIANVGRSTIYDFLKRSGVQVPTSP